MLSVADFSDEDVRRVMLHALRLMLMILAVAIPLVWWKMGWPSAAMLVIGAVISGSGLWEWLRLMTVVMSRMDGGGCARPMGMVLTGFFLRLGVAVGLLYVSLRFLDGSVYALVAGLAMGVFALTFEALKMVKAWTV